MALNTAGSQGLHTLAIRQATEGPIVSCFPPMGQAAQQGFILKTWACGVPIVGTHVGAVPKH